MALNSTQENPINIFNRAWPDIILAKSRILKLNTFAKQDTISITIRKGAIPKGTPEGKNKFVIFHFCSTNPMILIPVKCIKAKKKVITNELVTVKEYGINPTRFATNINENKKKRIVKY